MGAAAFVGTLCMFIPGGQVVGVPLLIASAVMGVGVSGYELYKMNSQGESINLSNPMARSHWMMIAGSAAGVGRLGIIKWVANPGRFATGTANVLGFTATYTGFHMMAVQTQNLLVNGANMSWDERLFSIALLGSGGAQMAMGGLGFRGRGQAAPSERVIGSPRQTGRSAYNFWRRPGSQNGLTSAFWRTAETDFQTNVGAPGFRAWDAAGRPTTAGNAPWNEAITQLQPEITARAQTIAGRGNAVTAAHTTQAENALAGQIGMRPHEIWVVNDRPAGGAAESVWNSRGVRRAERLFNTRVSRDGFRLWDAESSFEGAVGETAFKLWVKAGRPADQVWTDAMAKYQPQIDARAQQLSGGPGTTPTAKQISLAEAEFAGRIGVEAYTNWRGNMQGMASAHWTDGEAAALGSPAYRLWVKAGKPNDQFWVDAEAHYRPMIDARAQEISGAGKPVTAKAQKRAEAEFAGRIGLLARESWIAAGKPATGAATAFWPQAETQFLAKIAEPSYRFWKLHGNPNDVHWTRAVADFQPQIDARAQQLSGAGNPITAKARTTAEGEYGGRISLKAREYWETDGRPGTTAGHWQLAEKKFQIQIGEPAYQLWETAGRTVGKDNTYFTQANELAQQEIGMAAYTRWTAKGGRPSGATAAHWRQADADLQTAIGEPAFRIWDTDGRPSTTHWDDAYAHFKAQIDARAQQLSGSGNTPTAAHFAQAEGEFAGQIGTRAHANWDGKPAGAAETHWMTAGTTHNNAVGGGAYQLWAAAGKPTGLHNTYWGRASHEYIKSDPYLDRIVGGGRDKWNSWGQRRADPDTYLRIRVGEYWSQGKFVLKWFGGAYAAINFAGLLAEAAYYFAGSENRTTPAVTQQNAEAELRKYLADPDGYRDDNYENTVFGVPVGDNLYNFKGHLFAFTGDNGVTYFRRIPEDLYNALKEVPNPQGYKVTPEGIFVTETIKLSETGGFELGDPMQGEVDEDVKLQIGIRAFDIWNAGGVPAGAAGFDFFKNAETEYLRQNGVLAYDDWVAGGKLTTGDNAVWLQATQNFQDDIDRRAQELWQQSGGQGSGPTAAQRFMLATSGARTTSRREPPVPSAGRMPTRNLHARRGWLSMSG